MSKHPEKFTEENLSNIKAKFYSKVGFEELKSPRKNRKRFYSIPVVAVISLSLVTSAAGMGVLDLSFMLNYIGIDTVKVLQPIDKVSEQQGIKMETIAAINDDEMAVIYFTMTDLSGDRIDDTLDIYHFHVSGFTTHNAQLIHYDEITNTATMRMLVNGGKKLNGKKITVRIDSFLSGAKTEKNYNPGLDLYTLLKNNPQGGIRIMNRDTDHISGGGGEGFEEKSKPGEVVVLEQDKLQLTLPGMEWQYISNIGFIDGKLHIQANPEPDMGRFNYGSFYFTDSNGIKQNIANNYISYGGYEIDQIGWGGDYIEYVYDISDISQLKDLKLMGEFTTYTNYFRGKWETSFIMEATTMTKQASIHIKDDDAVIMRVEVSSLGITLTGEGLNKGGSSVDEITIHYKDGRVIHSESRISSSTKQVKLLYPEIIQMEEVDSVTINGQRVQVK